MMRGLLFALSIVYVSPLFAESYELPANGDTIVGQTYYVLAKEKDTLVDIAAANGVGYDEIKRANPGVDPWLPGEGTRVLIPSQFVLPGPAREGIVINLAEKRLYFYAPPRTGHNPRVFTYPISIGRQDWQTPLGVTRIERKKKDPNWYPPESIRKEHAEKNDPLPEVVPAGPDNPLGNRAMYLGIPGYLIHGTNKPAGIGMRVSHGCIRMLPKSIEELFDLVPKDTRLELIDMPFKIGILRGEVFIEAHDPANTPIIAHNTRGALTQLVLEATGGSYGYYIQWDEIDQALKSPLGVPAAVGFFNRSQTLNEGKAAGMF